MCDTMCSLGYGRNLEPMTDSEFVESRPVHKKKLYQHAVEELNGGSAELKHSFVKIFIKSEKTEALIKDDPIPRIIYPRHPIYNLCLGEYIVPIENKIYSCIDHIWNEKTVFKGLNASQQGEILWEKWQRFSKPCAFMTDASRFDQHCSIDALRFEHGVEKLFYSGMQRSELHRLLNMQLHTTGFANSSDGYKMRVTHRGGRCSGDQNTALGNIIIMTFLMLQFKFDHKYNFSLVNNGDDSVIIGEYEEIIKMQSHITAWFKDYGYTMKVEKSVTVFEEMDFCQTKPIFVDGKPIMCRFPKAALPKDCMCLASLSDVQTLDKWRRAVMLGGISLTGGVPIFQEFYLALGQNTENKESNSRIGGLDESGFWQLARGMNRKYETIKDSTRISFFKAFGIFPYEQKLMEAIYQNYKYDSTLRPQGVTSENFEQFIPPYQNE